MFEFQLSKELKKRKVSLRFQEDIEPHETLLDKLAKKKEEELGISERKFEVPLQKKVLRALLFFAIFLNLTLFAKTFQFQIIEGKELKTASEENKFKMYQIQAERGVIYDRNFNQLVSNLPSFDLICETEKLPQLDSEKLKVLKEVSFILGKNFEDLKTEIAESKEPVITISENLSHEKLIVLETKMRELPGFQIKNNTVRDYQEGPIFAHLIGYKRKTGEKTGLEFSYDEALREKPGEILIERDVKGNLISQKIVSLPESGQSLVLWLDSELQKKIEVELEKKIKEVGAKGGAAVALDPKTGGVLSLVSWPPYNNNLFSKEISSSDWEKLEKNPLKPLLNRATSGQYLLGSTIKPLIASAALEEKIISPEKKINCQGFIEIPHQYEPEKFTKKEDWTVHGLTDLRKAIAESCNVYFYTIGGGYGEQEGLGPTKIKKYLQLFGLGEISQIDLPIPEWATGLVPDPEWKRNYFEDPKEKYWWNGDTYNLAIGQGYILATPIQIASAFSTIANGGKLLEPHLVQKIVDKERNLIKEIQPKIIRENFIDPQNLQIVREGMRWAVTGQNSPHASAISLNSLSVSAAAKTGTAQVDRPGCKDCYNIWISVFAPYEDPKIVLTIVLEDVKGRLSGVVVPVAKEILNWYFTR
jgi:penicillin-binding protein 2